MSNILSIDMKFLLKPCIQLYTDMVNQKYPHRVIWDNIEETRKCQEFLSLDSENVSFIFNIFKSLKYSKNLKVCLSFDHTNIVRMINRMYHAGDLSLPLRIVNIDHAHDLGSSPQSFIDIVKYDIPTWDNWAQYLFSKELVDTYCWVSNENSVLYNGPDLGDSFFNVYKQDFVFNQDEYDLLFISSSLNWFPRSLINKMIPLLQPVFDTFDTEVFCFSDHYRVGYDRFDINDYKRIAKDNLEEV